jgi:hypothetical protein
MRNMNLKTILVAIAVLAAGVASSQETPKSWVAAGSNPKPERFS